MPKSLFERVHFYFFTQSQRAANVPYFCTLNSHSWKVSGHISIRVDINPTYTFNTIFFQLIYEDVLYKVHFLQCMRQQHRLDPAIKRKNLCNITKVSKSGCYSPKLATASKSSGTQFICYGFRRNQKNLVFNSGLETGGFVSLLLVLLLRQVSTQG